MKRILVAVFLTALAFALAACAEPVQEVAGDDVLILDFRSISDTELNRMFSLSDTRANIEAALGSPVSSDNEWDTHEYQNGLTVGFENDRAVSFSADNTADTGRFEIFGYRIGMTRSQIADNFEFDEEFSDLLTSDVMGWTMYVYNRFYDGQGNLVNEDDSVIVSGVHWREDADGITVSVSVESW